MTKQISYNAAAELERIIERKLGMNFHHTLTIFDNPVLVQRSFYDVLHLFIHMFPSNFDTDDYNDLVQKYDQYRNICMDNIPNPKQMLDDFKKFIKLD